MTDDCETLVSRGLDRLGEGFGIFNSDLCLVSCNRLFRDLRGYPEDVCRPGVRLEQLIRFNAERGDFGPGSADQQVSERMAEIAENAERVIKREMADGRVLRIRYDHMGADGLVVTFRDITEAHRAQSALAASEERYALVAEAAEEAIYEWDIERSRFFGSSRLEDMLGIKSSPSGEREWDWVDLIHPDDVAQYEAAIAAHLSGEMARWECEYRIKGKDGDYRWVSDHGTSVRDGKGRAIRLIAAIRDVTERIERDAALAASEERLALVAQATSDGLYDWNVETNALFVSERLHSLFAFERQVITSEEWASRVHDEDMPGYMAALVDHFKGNTGHLETEYRILSGDGGYRWVLDRGIGVRNQAGRVVRLVGAVRDVTEIKVAQSKLDRAEKRLLESLETISDGYLLVDQDDNVQMWNRRYMEIFGSAAGRDISDIVVAGRPFIEMIKDGYVRGMFKPHPGGVDGWIADRRKSRMKAAADLQMELSNGHWLLINERRMSDGGRVSIYTDITDFKTRERELESARTLFEDAIEALSSGFALFDADDRIVVCNTKYREYFVELEDMVEAGRHFSEIVNAGIDRGMFPAAAADRQAWLADLMERRAATHGVREQKLKNGIWLQVSDHRTKDGGIVSIYTDVTELKTQEEELRRQSAILEATLENMGQAISMVDSDLNVVMFNKKFLEYFDFPEADFKRGFHMSQAFRFNAERGEYGEGDVEEQIRERLELAARFQPHRFERTRPDGMTLEMVGNPVETGGFVTTYTDITERKQAEQALRDREAQLRAALQEFNAVLDSIEYGVAFMDPSLRVRIINRAFSEMWGISQEVIDTSPTMKQLIEHNKDTGVYDVAPQDWDAWLATRLDVVKKGNTPATELKRADGKVLQYQVIALPDGGRMLTYFDITELKRREDELIAARDHAQQALAELQKAQERLVQAEKMASLGQLTAGIAHEIKNPLNFVNNFANLSNELLGELSDILQEPLAGLGDEDRDDAEDILDTIRRNLVKINEHGRRADSIVKNMLLHSREGPSEIQRSNINAIAEQALNLAYHGARAENSDFNVDMQTSLAEGLGEIECFPQDLVRVLLNLISNGMYAASRYRGSGGETAPVVRIETEDAGRDVVIKVFDNGPGIPRDIRDKIFTPFFTTKPPGEGTGLGLSLSYDIVVKQHGGSMTVDSEPDRSTIFTVTLPRVMSQGALKEGATA